MSHLRSSLLAFLVLGVVISGLAATEDVCNEQVAPGSETPKLSSFESKLVYLRDTKNSMGNKWNSWFGKKARISPFNFADAITSLPEVQTAKLIPPGLKWCGDGDRAKNYDDLGYFNDTDACCRGHDLCSSNIFAGETLVNLNNNAMFTRSACNCDQEFYTCLKKVGSTVSKQIGKVYFNTLGPQCFDCICPTEECKKDDGTECRDHCTRYKWCDNPKY